MRAVLVPTAGEAAIRLVSVAVVENTSSEAAVDAAFRVSNGNTATVRLRLQLGQTFIQTEPRGRVEALRLVAPCRFAVMPDFFADDIAVDATELPDFISEMEELARRIDGAVAARKDGIATPEYAAQLVEEFRATLIDYEGSDALEKCKKITAEFVKIGGSQDELVGECRMAVKIIRQKAGLATAVDPQTAPVAKEIRRRTQEMLRNPVSYEASRH